jgi:hypothetical protein
MHKGEPRVRKSILFVLVAALALVVGFSSLAVAGLHGATVSAKKANKKGKRCKSKGKKGKRKGCKGGKSKGKWPPASGRYLDTRNGVTLLIAGRGKRASVELPNGNGTCLPLPFGTSPEPAKVTKSSLTVSYSGGPGIIKSWRLTLKSDYSYKLVVDSSIESPGQPPCSKPGLVFAGTVKKAH